jgi:hypothetical protein
MYWIDTYQLPWDAPQLYGTAIALATYSRPEEVLWMGVVLKRPFIAATQLGLF